MRWFTSRPFSQPNRTDRSRRLSSLSWRGEGFRAEWGSGGVAVRQRTTTLTVVVTMTRRRCNYDRVFSQPASHLDLLSFSRFLPFLAFSFLIPFLFPFSFTSCPRATRGAERRMSAWSRTARRYDDEEHEDDGRDGRTEGGRDWPSWRDWPSAMMVSGESIGNMKCQYVSRWYSRTIITVIGIFPFDDLWQIPI